MRLADAVADVVRKQRELGIDIPDDGEFGKPVAGSYDYGAWWNYAFARMSGFSPAGSPEAAAPGPSAARNARSLLNSTLLRRAPPQRRPKAARARRGYTASPAPRRSTTQAKRRFNAISRT